jgi:4-aminobutyrate aminotransferase-like enzyme
MPGCYHIPAPYTYRNPFNETDPAKLAQLCLAALEDEIKPSRIRPPLPPSSWSPCLALAA